MSKQYIMGDKLLLDFGAKFQRIYIIAMTTFARYTPYSKVAVIIAFFCFLFQITPCYLVLKLERGNKS